ncbi:morphogenic membrane protein MmpB [Kitasatospora sp. CMC57]
MLWSDPPDETTAEARRVQRMLRRAGSVLAACALVMAVLLLL